MTPIRTMIAEDDQRIAEIQNRFLEKMAGFEVVGMAHTLEDCAEMIEVLRPDLLLLDIHFPDGNGLEFLESLRSRKLRTEVILITAAKDVESLKKAMHGGVFDYVVKPLEFNRMRDSLQHFETYFTRLSTLDTLEQADIDGLMPRAAEPSGEDRGDLQLPKGIDSLTLGKIRELLRASSGSLSAESVGQNIGASRTTARRYLEYLVSTSELEVDVSYGGVGRPERHYRRK
ncbi:MAG: response regulator [Gammaproteobacteria bacterium]|nr:MAG: response regulator [Gammaproteobacteria bacterium]UCH38646.1 MAG: response regulator [Gammaproteobacteria bacterium]